MSADGLVCYGNSDSRGNTDVNAICKVLYALNTYKYSESLTRWGKNDSRCKRGGAGDFLLKDVRKAEEKPQRSVGCR